MTEELPRPGVSATGFLLVPPSGRQQYPPPVPINPTTMAPSTPESSPSNGTVDVTIYVPCYNEEKLVCETLKTILEAVSTLPITYEVLIFDDGSKDRTSEVARAFIAGKNIGDRFQVIRHDQNRGIGVNFFDAAERGRGTYFIVVAGDDGEPAETLRRVLNLMGKADAVIPYFDTRLFDLRFNGDNRIFIRRLLSIWFAWIVRFISGHNIHYYNGCILHRRVNVLKHRVEAFGLAYQAEMLCKILSEPGASFLEVKVYNRDRVSGTTTAFRWRNIMSVAASLGRILRDRLAYRKPA